MYKGFDQPGCVSGSQPVDYGERKRHNTFIFLLAQPVIRQVFQVSEATVNIFFFCSLSDRNSLLNPSQACLTYLGRFSFRMLSLLALRNNIGRLSAFIVCGWLSSVA